ncbi:MAG: tripartite tricarboxylate transporter family receptor [Hyphomicrobiales bacterium]|nr:tripartite tricarboxylate transporter family receptor [Hyphomicrobiales bacterium]
MRKGLRLLAALAATSLSAGWAQAQTSVENFYRNNALTIIVGYSPGAAYDLYARTVAQHLGKQIPGNPKVIVQNMPGAGSMNAVNYLYTLAKKDGSQIAAFARGIAMQPLLDDQGVKFDATKLGWIGSPSSEVSVVLSWKGTAFKTLEDVRQREMSVAVSGSGADSAIFPRVMNSILGTKFKLVTGYPGNSEMLLAVERGEVDGNAGTSWSTLSGSKSEWVSGHRINILAQLGLKKHPDLPDVPLVTDLAKTPDDRKVLELIVSRQDMAYPFAAPPEVPEDRFAALRAGFDKMVRDPDFIADAKKQGFEVDPMSGADMESLVKKLYASPPALVERARAALRINGKGE